MRHHILVKFADSATDLSQMRGRAEEIFAPVMDIPGVHGYSVHMSSVDRPNRYDLMVVIHMDEDALPRYDASPCHKRWKDELGPLFQQKAIFDCD